VPLVEVVPAPWTRSDIPEKTKAIMIEIGQKPVVLNKEIDGFALNRIQYVIRCVLLAQNHFLNYHYCLTIS